MTKRQKFRNSGLYRWVLLLTVPVLGIPLSLAKAEDGLYQVVQHNLPKTVQPGQQVIGRITVKVVTPGLPVYPAPEAFLTSLEDTKKGFNLGRDKFTPYYWPKKQAAGDILTTIFTLDVPSDFPTGAAEIGFMGARNVPVKGWQYAQFQSHDAKPLGNAFRWKLTVVKDESSSEFKAMALPLIIKRMAVPTLDGRVNKEEWKDADVIERFQENMGGKGLKAQTQAYVGYDDKNLYIACVCEEPMMTKAAQMVLEGRDPPVWKNECVEVLLNPQADRASYLHFVVDILNQRYDALGSDAYGYNPKWTSAVCKGDKFWSVEMAIPFSSLAVSAPKSGQIWFANICRERQAEAELSAWQPALGSFDAVGKFGTWVFGALKDYFQDKASRMSLKYLRGVKELTKPVEAWDKSRRLWLDQLLKMDDSAARAVYPRLVSEIDRLGREFDELKFKKMRLSGASLMAVTQSWPYQKFNGEISSIDKPAGPVSVTLLRDEWVDLAWNIKNFNDKPITLRCVLHRGQYNRDQKQEYLRIGFPGVKTQWQQAFPVAAADDRRAYDAIVPIPAGIIQIPAGATSQVWLSIQGPQKISKEIKGNIVFEPVDGAAIKPLVLPLTFTTVPVSLVARPAIHCFTWNAFWNVLSEQPDWLRIHHEDLKDHGVDIYCIGGKGTLPRVKAHPDGSLAEKMDFSRLDALLVSTRGVFDQYFVSMDIWAQQSLETDLFGLPFGSPAYEKAFKTWFRQVVDHLLAKGITYDHFMINPYDESVNKNCQAIARWIKETDPKVRVAIDSSTPDLAEARQMDKYTDIWIPHYKTFFAEDIKPFHQFVRSTGKPYWFYFYSEGGNEKHQDPTLNYLAKFWWAYANKVGGVCYWTETYYGDPWYRAGWRGAYDTSLVYPIEGSLIPSRRWQAWRRGWQDHCLLTLVQKEIEQKNDKLKIDEFQKNVQRVISVPGDPARAEAVRVWLRNQVRPVN